MHISFYRPPILCYKEAEKIWGSSWKWELVPAIWGLYLRCFFRVTDNLLCLNFIYLIFSSEGFVSCLLSFEYIYLNICWLCSCFTFSFPFPHLVCVFWAWSANHNSLQTGQRQTCLLCTGSKYSNFFLFIAIHVLVCFCFLVSLCYLQRIPSVAQRSK